MRDFENIVRLQSYFYSFDKNFIDVNTLDCIDYEAYRLKIELKLPKIIDYLDDDDEAVYIEEVINIPSCEVDSIYEVYDSFEKQIKELYEERKGILMNELYNN